MVPSVIECERAGAGVDKSIDASLCTAGMIDEDAKLSVVGRGGTGGAAFLGTPRNKVHSEFYLLSRCVVRLSRNGRTSGSGFGSGWTSYEIIVVASFSSKW
jgi:hypothetical protein